MLCFIPSFGYIHVYRSKSRLSLIVRVNVVLNRTVVVDNNRTVVVPLSLSFAFDYGEMSSPKRLGLIALLFILLKLLLLLLLLLLFSYYYYYYYYQCIIIMIMIIIIICQLIYATSKCGYKMCVDGMIHIIVSFGQ